MSKEDIEKVKAALELLNKKNRSGQSLWLKKAIALLEEVVDGER